MHTYQQNFEAYDLLYAQSALLQKAPSLFVTGTSASRLEFQQYVPLPSKESDGIENGLQPDQGQTIPPTPHKIITTLDELQPILQGESVAGSHKFMSVNISRANSWSRMKITLEAFEALRSSLGCHPGLLELISGMGNKSTPADEHYMSSYSDLRMATPKNSSQLEAISDLCYSVQYYEKHGRNLDDPWACRQSVTYQRCKLQTNSHTWITIHPAKSCLSSLRDVRYSVDMHPLILHIRFLRSSEMNFREYLNDISAKLLVVDQTVSFPKPLTEYDFEFAISQEVHSLRRKLYRFRTVLAGHFRALEAIRAHADAIQDPGGISPQVQATFKSDVAMLASSLESHQSTAEELLRVSGDVKSTCKSVLEFRNQEILHRQNAHLQRIAEQEAQEAKAMSELTTWMYNDSRATRIATIIAMIYLPANIVLAFFSSVFVEIVRPLDHSSDPRSGSLVVHQQLWMAVVSILVLIGTTFSTFWVWKRPQGSLGRVTP